MNDIRQRARETAKTLSGMKLPPGYNADALKEAAEILRMVAGARDLSGDDIYNNVGTPIAEGRRVLVILLDEEKAGG